LSRINRCRPFVDAKVGDGNDDVFDDDRLLLLFCPQVARFSDLSAISSSCLGLMSV
jgi:hypothetical protein